MIRSVRSLLLLLVLLAAPVRAEQVELTPGRGFEGLEDHLVFATDPKADLGTMLERYRSGTFGTELDLSLLSSNYAPETWAAVELVNVSLDDGRPPDPFALTVALPLGSVYVYLIRENGLTEALLDYSIFAPFDPSQHSANRIRTPVFTLAPGERATLMVKLFFGPFQSFGMALETPEELQANAFAAGISITAFYVFSLVCMIFFLAFFVALRDWISLLYGQLFLVGLALIAYVDGLLFRFVYPDHPQWQSTVGFGLMFALSGAGFVLSAYALRHRHPRVSRLIWWLAGTSLAGFLVSLYSPGTYAAFAAYVLMGIMAVAVYFGNNAWREMQSGRTYRLAQAMAVTLVAALAAMAVMLATGLGQGWLSVAQGVKLFYVVMLIATLVHFAAQILFMRRRQLEAEAQKLAALEAEAKRARELLEAERNYSRARDLAQRRQRQLATASHDLRQPLASLRLTLDGIGTGMDPVLRSRMAEAFDYMEQLSGEYLKEQSDDEDDETAAPAPAEPEATEPYALSLIVESVWQMFHDEAVSKGLALRRVASGLTTDVPPMALMRIVSNLVANAVKYTGRGRVLVGVRRRRGGMAEIQVLDTGPGMNASEIALFRQEGRKGAQSDGHGLGLAVCFGLAAEHGLNLDVRSEPGRGTAFFLRLPAVATVKEVV